jgi:hypothetical protein
MTASGKSLFYFGVYAICAGLLFLLISETVITLTRLPVLPTGWARVIGMLALVIGTYDMVCGKADIKIFIQASVYTRLGFAFFATIIVISGYMPISMFLIGLVDALGAGWTIIALRSEAHNR